MSEAPNRISIRLIVGLAVTAIGVALMLDAADVFDADQVLRFWPLAMIAVGAVLLQRARTTGSWFPGMLVIFLGGVFLLEELGYLEDGLDKLWPLIIILLGLAILGRGFKRPPKSSSGEAADTVSKFAVLCGLRPKVTSQSFKGGDLSSFMGGCELDLRGADLGEEEAVIDVFTLMGGIEITVPRTWTVTSEVTPFMGGMEDSTDHTERDPDKRLRVRGFVMMGGLEIKN